MAATEHITLRIAPDLKRELVSEAAVEGTTLSKLVEQRATKRTAADVVATLAFPSYPVEYSRMIVGVAESLLETLPTTMTGAIASWYHNGVIPLHAHFTGAPGRKQPLTVVTDGKAKSWRTNPPREAMEQYARLLIERAPASVCNRAVSFGLTAGHLAQANEAALEEIAQRMDNDDADFDEDYGE